jgi:BTB/POZ domain
MSDRPTKKTKMVKSSPSSSQSPSPVTLPPAVIINGARSDKVDFTIVVNEKTVKTRYGVEKTALALHSTFFKDLFDKCSKKNDGVAPKEDFEIKDEFPNNVVRRALGILSGIVDKGVWTIE